MDDYFVNRNAQSNGDHEVHKTGCYWLTLITSPLNLGKFYGCASAVVEARKHYNQVNGCVHCSEACHTG